MAVDIFLKIEGIQGESQDESHKNEIEVLSWSWGESQVGSAAIGGGMGAGKVSMQDFNFTMYTGKATAKLMEACATGKHIPEATLAARKAGGKPYDFLKIKFSDLLVTSYQTGGAGEIPIESCSFNFSKVQVEYFEQASNGNVSNAGTFKYDLKKNTAA
ncbi:MAG: type VI secretion system tube protein Hcp [Acidobacteriota bacterium]|nr:type VI secretion system tube protein Hcp [Acidobacteriota bacterium]